MLRIKRKSTVVPLKNGGTRITDELEVGGFRVTGQVEITLKPSWRVKGQWNFTLKCGK